MKSFAGIELNDLKNSRNIFTIEKIRRAIDQHLQRHLNNMPCATTHDLRAKRELENLYHERISAITHLKNYSRLVGHLPRLPDTYIQYPWAPESLNALIDLAVKCAPYDWHIRGTLPTVQSAIRQIGEHITDEKFFENFDLESFRIFESEAKELFAAATAKNLEIAFEQLHKVIAMTEAVEFASNLPFVVGLQIYHYLSMLSYLKFYSGEDLQVAIFEVRVAKELDDCIKILEQIREPAKGCFAALTYLFSSKHQSDSKTNQRVAPKLSLDI